MKTSKNDIKIFIKKNYMIGLILILLVCIPSIIYGQTISIVEPIVLRKNNPNEYNIDKHKHIFSTETITYGTLELPNQDIYTYHISPNGNYLVCLKTNEVMELYDDTGTMIYAIEVSPFNYEDNPYVYVTNYGNVIYRSNIAYVNVYDVQGNSFQNVSTASGSKYGESIANIIPNHTVGNGFGAYNLYKTNSKDRIQVSNFFNNQKNVLLDSADIKIVGVYPSKYGSFMSIAYEMQNSQKPYSIIIKDLYGNTMYASPQYSQEPINVYLDEKDNYLKVVLKRRVILSHFPYEKTVSSSISSDIISTKYLPEDDIIIIIAGEPRNGSYEQLDIKIIKIKDKKIMSESYTNDIITVHPFMGIAIEPLSPYKYRLEGINNPIEIHVNF